MCVGGFQRTNQAVEVFKGKGRGRGRGRLDGSVISSVWWGVCVGGSLITVLVNKNMDVSV